MYLEIKFGDEKNVVELYDSPVTRAFIKSHKIYLGKNIPQKTQIVQAAVHCHEDRPYDDTVITGGTAQQAIDMINEAIDGAESCIDGKPFPLRPFLGMGWKEMNKIHRHFTTASATLSTWTHTLSRDQLIELKSIQYQNKGPFMIKHAPKDFTVTDMEGFKDHIERINQGVHLYETFNGSPLAQVCSKVAGCTDYFEIDWDHRMQNGHMSFFHGERVSAGDVKNSFPTDYSEADLFVGKMVEGKDYEFAFCEYDDALEFDITNLDWICGDMRLHYDKRINDFYTKSEYNVWTKEAGLEDWMHLPVPLGKLVEVNSDFSTAYMDYDSPERTSDMRPVCNYPFKEVSTKLVV